MDRNEFTSEGLDMGNTEYLLANGEIIYGNIAQHFPIINPDSYFLVRSTDMIEFANARQTYEQKNDDASLKKIRSLASLINLKDIVSGKRL